MFDKKGLITIDPSKSNKTFDELFDVAVEAGAEDVQEVEGEEGTEWTVSHPPSRHGSHYLFNNDVPGCREHD